LGRADLPGDELEIFVTSDRLSAFHQVARSGPIEDDPYALDLRSELLEQPEWLLHRDVHAGSRDVLRIRPDDAWRIEDHGIYDGDRCRATDHRLERPAPDGKDEVRLDLGLDLGQVLPTAVDVTIHVVRSNDLVSGRFLEATERLFVLGDLGTHEDGHPRGGRRARDEASGEDEHED